MIILQVMRDGGLGFRSKDTLFRKIDALPQGPGWTCTTIEAKGDLVDSSGNPLVEYLDVWHRNPIDVIKDLLGNPHFKDSLQWSAIRRYRDNKGKVQEFSEMSTGDWWWETQVCSRNHYRQSMTDASNSN